jgi:hypothetical protein
MLRPFVLVLTTFFSLQASALPSSSMIDRELEAMALLQLQEEGLELNQPRDLGDFLQNLQQQVQELKDSLLAAFDTNGNGRIDPGPEWDNFTTTVRDVVLLLADSNQNGRIDASDLAALSEQLLMQAQEQVLTRLCPEVTKQAEAAGPFLPFRPLLNQLYKLCQDKV